MILRLLDLDRRAALLPRSRDLIFPDGETNSVSAPVLVWRWYDHLLAAEFGPKETNLLRKAQSVARIKGVLLGDALARVVAAHVRWYEDRGADLTDFDLEAMIAGKSAVLRTRRK